MSPWDIYQDRIQAHGGTKRGATYVREVRLLRNRLPDSLSYHAATIFVPEYGYNIDHDEMREYGDERNVAIINSDNLNEKFIFSLPGEDIELGSLVEWMDNRWLVTERDANTTVYTRAKLLQCNYLLKWIAKDGTIVEQWCAVEDGTKYLTGEFEDRYFATVRGDSRIAVTIARTDYTKKLGRENRFLIDDPESELKLAYTLSKPFKLTGTYNNQGVYKFVLQEVETTDNDNQDMMIADYYKAFPESGPEIIPPDATGESGGRKAWL